MTRLALCLLLLAPASLVATSTAWLAYEMRELGQSKEPIGCERAGNQRQLSPHETQPEPTPAAAPAAWNDERYQL